MRAPIPKTEVGGAQKNSKGERESGLRGLRPVLRS